MPCANYQKMNRGSNPRAAQMPTDQVGAASAKRIRKVLGKKFP